MSVHYQEKYIVIKVKIGKTINNVFQLTDPPPKKKCSVRSVDRTFFKYFFGEIQNVVHAKIKIPAIKKLPKLKKVRVG